MADGIAWGSLLDAVESSRSHYPLEPDFTTLLAHNRWPFINDILSRAMVSPGGKDLKHIFGKKETGAASMTLPWQTTDINQEEILLTLTQDWRRAQTYWNVEDTEDSFNMSPEEIVSLIKVRRTGATHSMAKLIEDAFWTRVSSTSNEDEIRGIPYFLPEITGAQVTAGGGQDAVNGDFQAGNPFDAGGNQFSTYLGQSRATAGNERLKTYAENWEGTDGFKVARDIRALDQALLETFFEAPLNFELGGDAQYDWRFYTDRTNVLNLKEQARAQDMNLGPDILEHNGGAFINNTIVRYAPQLNTYLNLDGTASHPFFGINLREIKVLIKQNRNMIESRMFVDKEQHTVGTMFIDLMLTTMGYNTQTMGFNISYKLAA